ncbi:MAG: glycogen/starch synthase, partial [Flavobacteriales bacterium]|nr:glycogen/starch synthase [Flavobacteriales bacterium]
SKDPVFENAKVVYSLYNNDFEGKLNKDLIKKAYMEGMDKDRVKEFSETCFVGLNKAAINCSDAVIKGSENLNKDLQAVFDEFNGPKLDYQSPEEYINAYSDFYDEVFETSEVLIG